MRSPGKHAEGAESGQATIGVVLALGIFLLGAMGFGVDFSDLWFHQQKAQAAADAACQAGAMDLLEISQGSDTTTSAGFTPGTGFDCSTASSAAPCKYASLNAYAGAGLSASSASNDVAVSFPSSVPGVTAPPVGIAGSYPFMRVDITDRVQVFFSGMLTGSRTQDVHVAAKCGLVLEQSPVPILVLSPTASPSLSVQGTPDITIEGGPTRSVQVNSNSLSAINIGGNAEIDLSKGGPSDSGSSLGVTGAEALQGGFVSATPASNYWDPSTAPLSDPFAQLAEPSKPVTNGTSAAVGSGVNGCPDSGGCTEYTPGYYPSPGITIKGTTAIFDPGIYYVVGGMSLDSNSIARPSTVTGNGNGTMFFFSGTGTISVAANSGKKSPGPFNTSAVQCPGGSAVTITDSSGNVVTQLSGTVLLGICTGPYGDPLGLNRGMLFFQDRSAAGVNPNWGGGGQFLLAGNMYFHYCNASGTGTSCSASAYTDDFSMGGNSGSGTYVLGDIITDQLTLGGTSGIEMQLNPTSAYNILKAELLQ